MSMVLELLKTRREELVKAVMEIDVAIEILAAHGLVEDKLPAPMKNVQRVTGEKSVNEAPKSERTIRSVARQVLDSHPHGMKTRDLFEFLTNVLGIEIASPESLYATLIKYTDEFERNDNLWSVSKKTQGGRAIPRRPS